MDSIRNRVPARKPAHSPITFRAGLGRPCPVCLREKSCSRTEDGLHFCMGRTESGDGWTCFGECPRQPEFFIFRTADEVARYGVPADIADYVARADVELMARTAAAYHHRAGVCPEVMSRHAAALGLPPDAWGGLDRVGLTAESHHAGRHCLTFPRVDADGNTVGIGIRLPVGGYTSEVDSHEGLYVPVGFVELAAASKRVFLAEGPSCTAALAAGLAVIGRTSNLIGRDGAEYAAALLGRLPDVEVFVLGEWDTKHDTGEWPGRGGALSSAKALAEGLGRLGQRRGIRWGFPPRGVGVEVVKDSRDWLTSRARGEMTWPERGEEFVRRVLAGEVYTVWPMTVAEISAASTAEARAGAVGPIVEPAASAAAPPPPPTPAGTGGAAILPRDRWDSPEVTASAVLSGRHVVRVRDQVYLHDGSRYVPVGDEVIDSWLSDELHAAAGRHYAAECAAFAARQRRTPPQSENVTRPRVANAAARLHARTQCPALVDGDRVKFGARISTGAPVRLLPVANGLLDPYKRTLHPADPDVFAVSALPVAFDPAAVPSARFVKMVEGIANGNDDRVQSIQEMFGACVDPFGTHKLFWMLPGSGDNGKSALFVVLRALLGPANYSAVPLDQLGERFAMYGLFGKLANIVGDQARFDSHDESNLKAITGGDAVRYEPKGKNAFSAPCTARLVINCNALPTFSDRSHATWRRLRIIRCDAEFTGTTADTSLADESTWAADLPGILNWALIGLDRLRTSGTTETKEDVEAKAQHRRDSDPIRAYLEETYQATDVDDPLKRMYSSSLWQDYTRWCDAQSVPDNRRCNRVTFGRAVRHVFPRAKTVDGHEGSGATRRTIQYWSGIVIRATGNTPGA